MPKFIFRAASSDGHIEQGDITAVDVATALHTLEERGLTVFNIGEMQLHVGSSSRRKISQADLVVLIRELATLANAGISLATALDTLQEASRGTALHLPLSRMLESIHAGEGFSVAIEKAALNLPEYVFAMVRAGEATSNLGLALNRAAEQMEFDAKMRAQTREALVYPAILVSTGSIAVLFIFSFVVPRFAGLLKGRMDNLPWISEVTLRIGMFFNAYLLETLTGLAVFIFLMVTALRKPALRNRILQWMANTFIIGEWIRSGETARWTNSLAVLLQSRVGILPALELSASSVRLDETAARLNQVRNEVNRGQKLSSTLEHQQLLEPISLSMIKVGEQSGELGAMLEHVAHYWSDKNQSLQRRMVSLIEPVSILLLGVIIGFVMVGVVLAMTSLTEVKF